MKQVKVANNTQRKTIIVDGNTTIRECFEQAGIPFTKALVSLDGRNVSSDKLDTPLSELTCADEVSLMAIIKNDNA